MGSDDPHQAAAVGAGKCSWFDPGREAAEVGLEQPLDEPDQRSLLQLRQTAAQAAIAADTFCIYTLAMEFTWSARKRSLNLKEHGLDFVDAITVFQGLTFTFEDDRFSTKSSDSSLSDCSLALLSQSSIRRPPMKSASSRSEKRPTVKRKFTSAKSKTDRSRLRSGKASSAPEHPEAEMRHIVRGVVRQGLKIQPAKSAISLRVDQDVLEWFKSQGPGYQTRINAVLRAFRDASV